MKVEANFLIGKIWAFDPILLTDNLILTPGLILFKNKSSSTKICPSVIEITLVGIYAVMSPPIVSITGKAVKEPP